MVSAIFQHVLAENQIHALLVTTFPIFGIFPDSPVVWQHLLVAEESAVLFSDGRYSEQARDEVKNARIAIGQSNLFDATAAYLKEHIRSRHGWRLGFEADYLTVHPVGALREVALGNSADELAQLVENGRLIKDQDEIDLMRKAAKVGAGLFPPHKSHKKW